MKKIALIAIAGLSLAVSATYAMPSFSTEVFPWLMEKGLTKFKTESDFRPNDAITRGEAAKFVTNYAGIIGLVGNESACEFDDTANYDSSLKEFVTKSCILGLFKGSMKKFMPNKNITEAQALTVVVRSLHGKMDETMNPWYKGYFMKAQELGLITSETQASVDSKNITRAKLATWLYQASKSKMVMKDQMEEKQEMIKSVGMYVDYNMDAVKKSLMEGKKVALFFHAPWCPSCVAADKDLKSMTLTDNSVIYKVDYDTMTDLKKQFGVTTQHTFVFLDKDMNATSTKKGLSAADAIAMLK